MSDYFGRLAARVLDPSCLLQPNIAPRFAWRDEVAVEEPVSTPVVQQRESVSTREMRVATTRTIESMHHSHERVVTQERDRVRQRAAAVERPSLLAPEEPVTSRGAERSQRAGPQRAESPPLHSTTIESTTINNSFGTTHNVAISNNSSIAHHNSTTASTIITPERIERVVERVVERPVVQSTAPAVASEPDIHITIGRIDVRSVAALAATSLRPPAPQPSRESRPKTLSLEEFLAQRSEARR